MIAHVNREAGLGGGEGREEQEQEQGRAVACVRLEVDGRRTHTERETLVSLSEQTVDLVSVNVHPTR